MRRIGNVLMVVGAAVGVCSGVWLLAGPTLGGLAWLVGMGLIKLALVTSLAIMGTGAVALRIANRRESGRLRPGGDETS
jgi:hypothetical protein